MTTFIPVELAQSRNAASDAWTAYLCACEIGAGVEDALLHAQELEAVSSDWYARWQAIGGTSDIVSIVDAEPQPVNLDMSKTARFMSPDWQIRAEDDAAAWWNNIKPIQP